MDVDFVAVCDAIRGAWFGSGETVTVPPQPRPIETQLNFLTASSCSSDINGNYTTHNGGFLRMKLVRAISRQGPEESRLSPA